MKCGYTLEWLDSLINISLDPTKREVDVITPDQIQYIKSRIEEEKARHQAFLKNQIFSLLDVNKSEVLIKQYYSSLIILLDQAWNYKTNSLFKDPQFKEVHLLLVRSLEELISFIELRFPDYLDVNQRASVTHLLVIRKVLSLKTTSLKRQFEKKIDDKLLTDIVFATLRTFLTTINNGTPVALRDVLYIKQLVEKLQELSEQDYSTCNSAGLNKLLVYMNFNSQAYINYFIQVVKEKLTSFKDIPGQLEELLLLMKDFYQMNSKSGVALNAQEKELGAVIGNWFNQEVHYLEKKLDLPNLQLAEHVPQQKGTSEEFIKLKSSLTVDQISILLRSIYESKVVTARSLSAVFKQIAPYLSSSHKEDISPDSMRSKSYVAEARDKEIVIQTLELLIKKVKEY